MGTFIIICCLGLLLLMVGSVYASYRESNKEQAKREKEFESKYDSETLKRIKNHEVWTEMTLDQFTDAVPNAVQHKENGELYYITRDSYRVRFVFDDDYRLAKIIVR